ncbi:MAG: recombinase family protein [Candidatus Wallbacteria bacterium]|nr:recombinase family protein [Candidatus Wallbacteria bacterium]
MSNVEKSNNRAVIFARCSTNKIVGSASLLHQVKKCYKYAMKNGYEVVSVFKGDGESAKTNGTTLKELLKFIADKRNSINALIVWKTDRLMRRMVDYSMTVQLCTKLNVKILSVSEHMETSAMSQFYMSLSLAQMQLEQEMNRERSTAGMRRTVSEGFWCWHPPLGYKFIRSNKHKRCILSPDQNSKFITHAFFLAASGSFTLAEITYLLQNKGFKKLTVERLRDILSNPIYTGLIKTKLTENPVEGIHKAIVSREKYQEVQKFLLKRGNKLKQITDKR